jgi:hypothetical protein
MRLRRQLSLCSFTSLLPCAHQTMDIDDEIEAAAAAAGNEPQSRAVIVAVLLSLLLLAAELSNASVDPWRVRPVPVIPSATALSSLPACNRSLHWQLVVDTGFGHQVLSALLAAAFASFTGRAFFLHSNDFAYGSWAAFSLSLESQPAFYAPAASQLSPRQMLEASEEELSDEQPVLDALSASCPGQAVAVSPGSEGRVPHQPTSLCLPPLASDIVPYSGEDAGRDAHVSARPSSRAAVQSSRVLLQWRDERLPCGAPALFFLLRRRLRALLRPTPAIACQALRLMQRWSLRGKLPLPPLLPDFAAAAASPSSSSSSSSRRFIALHVRRGDKPTDVSSQTRARHELDYAELSRYLRAAEGVIAADAALNRSWPLMTRESLQANRSRWQLTEEAAALCLRWWDAEQRRALQSLPQPQVLLVSDDAALAANISLQRPCWRWMTTSQQERWSTRSRSWIPAAKARPGWELPASPAAALRGHWQQAFNAQPAAVRLSATASLLVDLLLLSAADYVVLTLSSYLGQLVALSRGWRDAAVQGRLISLDVALLTWKLL